MKKLTIVAVAAALSLTLLVAAGCGGGGSTGGGPIDRGVGSTALRVNLGDADADRIVAFELTINSIALTSSTGGTTSVLASPTRVELTHLAGIVEPLALTTVPQGTYTSAAITVSNAEVKYIGDDGLVHEATVTLTTSVTVTFSPAITIGDTPTSLNFDLNLASSITSFNPATGAITVNPSFAATAAARASEAEQEDETGEMEDITGAVTAVSGSTFTISVEQTAQNLTFQTNTSTEFEGVTLATLATGMIVEVDAITQADGTLLAKKVESEVEDTTGLEVEGLITSVTGDPATSIKLVVHDEAAPGAVMPAIGAEITVDVSGLGAGDYRVKDKHVDLAGLPFDPIFDASHIVAGQKVEVETDTPATDNLIADKVKLQRQALRGTAGPVSGPAGGLQTFTLTLAADSAFALLSGHTTVTVYKQPSTDLHHITTITGNVRVRGLLFWDGASFHLVASRIGN